MQVVELPCLVKSAPTHVIARACELISELNDLSTLSDEKVAVIVDQACRDHKIAKFLFVIWWPAFADLTSSKTIFRSVLSYFMPNLYISH